MRPKALAVLPALLLTAALATAPASAATSADLATSIVSPATTTVGSYLSYTITATNAGPDAASNVVISDYTPSYPWAAQPTTFYCLGSGTTWCGGLPPGVSCTSPPVGSPGLVTCTTASLAAGSSMTITIVVHVGFYLHNQIISDSATASSSTFDPNTANNTASVWARVN
jgi:uncharacterized repeat protein (TIGR01451 family)